MDLKCFKLKREIPEPRVHGFLVIGLLWGNGLQERLPMQETRGLALSRLGSVPPCSSGTSSLTSPFGAD